MALLRAFKNRAVLKALAHGLEDLRRMLRKLLQQAVDAHAEHSAVPQVQAVLQVLLGGGRIRFFNEARHGTPVAFFDVAKPRLGPGRLNTERHQPALIGQLPGAVDGLLEGRDVADQMIGRQHQQVRICAVTLGHVQRGSGDGGGGVAAEGLKDEVQRDVVRRVLAIVVKRTEIHVAVGHGQQLAHTRQAGGALKGLLQQALAIGQAHEGLRHGFTRHRPQSGARATGDDAGNEWAHSERLQGQWAAVGGGSLTGSGGLIDPLTALKGFFANKPPELGLS